jgi:hypothetical protein
VQDKSVVVKEEKQLRHAADLANGDGTVTTRLGPMSPQANPRALHVRSPLIVI